MASALERALRELSDTQRTAVDWKDGALLVLAGPGSGKTRVLTCRVAQLLERSSDERFRVLALTFTNKAAREMSTRVLSLVPGLEDRADIHTFHGFCVRVLRQHGVHLGIRPDFTIYARSADRQAVLDDVVRSHFRHFESDDGRLLRKIDTLKARLVGPEEAQTWMVGRNGTTVQEAEHVASAYRLYEDELRRANALDFNSLIFAAYKLFDYTAMVRHYRTVYRYWHIDEFQDTTSAQYKLLRRMAGSDFRQVFSVADDDQVIYEWNGACVHRIRDLIKDFDCTTLQLPVNYRCPAQIVSVANRLIANNRQRIALKQEAKSAQRGLESDSRQICRRDFETDDEEASAVAAEIEALDATERAQTLVLARTRALLQSMRAALEKKGVSAVILARRNDFASPQVRWLVACLRQINRPLDQRNFVTLVESFASFVPTSLDADAIWDRSVARGLNPLSVWLEETLSAGLPCPAPEIVRPIADLTAGELKADSAIQQLVTLLRGDGRNRDLADDLSAWQRLRNEIRSDLGPVSLDRFLQELDLRSKEAVPAPGSVSLATIHVAKGLEFDRVYLIGLAQEILPSWHSLNGDTGNYALEEERRSCFVAITRTGQHLTLSRARVYGGYRKEPSQFLREMGFGENDSPYPIGSKAASVLR